MKTIYVTCVLLLSVFGMLRSQSLMTIDTYAVVTGGSNTSICAASKTGDGQLTGDGKWCDSSPLPVELASFDAVVRDGDVFLQWTTATEINNFGFEILCRHCSTGNEWVAIGFVPGHGTNNTPEKYSFRHENPPTGTAQYRLRQIDNGGMVSNSHIIEVAVHAPLRASLDSNFPNPFNPTTAISYHLPAGQTGLPATSHVTLRVFDLLGREVATLVNETKYAGSYTVNWDASRLSSGVYFYRLQAGKFVETKRMILMK